MKSDTLRLIKILKESEQSEIFRDIKNYLNINNINYQFDSRYPSAYEMEEDKKGRRWTKAYNLILNDNIIIPIAIHLNSRKRIVGLSSELLNLYDVSEQEIINALDKYLNN